MKLLACIVLLVCVAAATANRAYPVDTKDLPHMPALVQTSEKIKAGDGEGAPEEAADAGAAPAGERSGPLGNPKDDSSKTPEEQELDQALQAVKDDIVAKSRQIQDEEAWVQEVKKITEEYNKKVARVDSNIVALRRQVKELYKKKKQIENLRLQKQLERKLEDASSDLAQLRSALQHVHSKETQFSKTREDIHKTISGIKSELAKLRGEAPSATDALAGPNEKEEVMRLAAQERSSIF